MTAMARVPGALIFVALTGVAAAACGGGGSGPTSTPAPVVQKTSSSSGDDQTATVGTSLANPLRVLVTLSGVPESGATVTWLASGSSGSVAPSSAVTDATGIAVTTWTLGSSAGSQSATATVPGATGSPLTFSATATAGAASQLTLAGGDNQNGSVNAALPVQLSVRTSDAFGNATAGTAVAWAVTGGAASVAPPSAVSDAAGVARTTVTLGATAGAVTITATNAVLTGSPVTFHATASTLRTAAGVQIGDFFFKSSVNGTQNPAVDTVAAGGTVTWTWVGAASHSVQSTGSPSFANSTIRSSGTYAVTFATAGTYTYVCGVHGAAMSGTVVVR